MVPVHDRIVLVRRGDDFKLSGFAPDQPHPSTAEAFGARIIELLLKLFEAAEGLLNLVADAAGWLSSAFGLHDLPEHGVVHMSARIVAYGRADVFRNAIDVPQQVLHTFAAELRMLFQCRVQIIDICSMM